jgi:Golgi SNAP receptor complex protein 2
MISELLPEEKRRLHELEVSLADLERGNPSVQVSDIQLGLQEMKLRLDELEKLALKESKTRRDDFRRRVTHLKNSHEHIRISFENYIRRRETSQYGTQKSELFGNRDIEDGSMLDAEVKENLSLSRSNKMVNEYLQIGQDTLNNLMEQKDRLKNIQRGALDILNYLGISNSMMRTVERREKVDRYIVFAGMFFITILLFLIWWYIL